MSYDLRLASIKLLIGAFKALESQVPPPRRVLIDSRYAYRYEERLPEQAALQKLARYISGLQASEWLNAKGFLQEQATIQRTLDDLSEDITYIILGAQKGSNKIHRKFLSQFWKEEFDDDLPPLESNSTRYHVSRNDIRKWLIEQTEVQNNSPEARSSRVIQQAYSGYVHGASPQIMEMCGGNPPRFCISGLQGTNLQYEHAEDLLNSHYRGLLACITLTKHLGDAPLLAHLMSFLPRFESISTASPP